MWTDPFPHLRNEFMYTRQDTPLSLGERFRYVHPGYELREQWSYSDLVSRIDACARLQ